MKLEHVALNVQDPLALAEWYVKHLGLKIARQKKEEPFTTFLSDDTEQMLIEIYNNPPDAVPVYKDMDPLLLHLAFVSANPEEDKTRLIGAGATFVTELWLEDGSHLVMLRDPWGLAMQLCKRSVPMLR